MLNKSKNNYEYLRSLDVRRWCEYKEVNYRHKMFQSFFLQLILITRIYVHINYLDMSYSAAEKSNFDAPYGLSHKSGY